MAGECYFCHGLVLPAEPDHIVLDGHTDHEVFMHAECARGKDAIHATVDAAGTVEVDCPECGAVETMEL